MVRLACLANQSRLAAGTVSPSFVSRMTGAVGGVPRPIRENCTALCLFKSAAQHGAQLEKIHSEIGTDIDLQKFDRLFTYSTSKPFGFLFVDFSPKSPDKQFRSGFDEFISL